MKVYQILLILMRMVGRDSPVMMMSCFTAKSERTSKEILTVGPMIRGTGVQSSMTYHYAGYRISF